MGNKNKRRKFVRTRQMSNPDFTLRPSNERLRVHLRDLSTVLSIAEISRRSGVPEATIHGQLNDARGHRTVLLDTAQALMRVRLSEQERAEHMTPEEVMWGGYRVVQGLMAMGWTTAVIGSECALTVHMLRAVGRTPSAIGLYQLSRASFIRLKEAAYRLEPLDPIKDGKIEQKQSRNVRSRALGRGSAPITAWDLDDVHKLDARPEWTGECGTPEGYRIHVRETIFEKNPMPPCDACRAAVEVQPPGVPRRYHLNRERLAEAIRGNKRSTVRALADRVLPDSTNARDTLYRWCDGSRMPRSIAVVERLAAELDIPLDELIDQEAMEQEAGEAVAVGNGFFNPYVLRVAMELSGTSQHKLAGIPDAAATQNTLGKWLRGESRPSDPSKVEPIAKFFGVKTEVFYT